MSQPNIVQVQQHKSSFDRVRKLVRKMQQERDKIALSGNNDDLEDNLGGYSKQERQLLQNRKTLEEAKQLGLECEEHAIDIKYNLKQQSHKLETSTLKNLLTMQRDLF